MVIPPQLIAAGASLFGKLFGPSSEASAGAQPFNAYTPQMLEQALAQNFGYTQDMESIFGAGGYGPGVNVSQTSRNDPKDAKAKAFYDFRIKKGDTPEEAQRKTNRILNNPNVKFKNMGGFKKAIKSGDVEGLSVNKRGGVDAPTSFTPGGVDVGDQSSDLRAFMNDLNAQSLGAASGLPGMYGADERRALGARDYLTGGILNQLNFSDNGLSPDDEGRIQSIQDKYSNDFKSIFDNSLNEGLGVLINSGFTSSSLADDVLTESMADPTDYATDSAAKMAALYDDMETSALGRKSQALNNSMNAFNSIGGINGMGSVMNPFDPNSMGLFNDPQAAAMAAEIQQSNIGNRYKNQTLTHDLMTQPVTMMPQPQNASFLSKLGSAALPAASMFGGMFPQTTGMFGNKFGNLMQGLDSKFTSLFGSNKNVSGQVMNGNSYSDPYNKGYYML